MNNKTITDEVHEISRVAGSVHYKNAINFSSGSFGDARNGLKYVLMRLTLLGITEQDREQLGELARLAFQESDVMEAANQIKGRSSASPLAVAIADIVAASSEQGGQKMTKMAMLGAVFGAYPARKDHNILNGILGAIAGAVAVTTSKFIQDDMEMKLWRQFVEMDHQ